MADVLVSDKCMLTTEQIAAADRARDRLLDLNEEMDEDYARTKAIFQAVRLFDSLGLRDVADTLEEIVCLEAVSRGRVGARLMRDLKALLDGIYGPFSRLSAEERSVLALRYWRKLDVAAVARELTFSERNVYRVTSRALGRLYRPVLEVQGLLEDWRVGRLK